MKINTTLAMIVILASTAAFQVYSRVAEDDWEPLLAGQRLDVAALTKADIARVRDAVPNCGVLWIMDPDCPGCVRLAERHGRTHLSRTFWVFAGSVAKVDTFSVKYELPGSSVIRLIPAPSPMRQLYRMGISATPTRLVVDPTTWIVSEVRVVDAVLMKDPEAELPSDCRA